MSRARQRQRAARRQHSPWRAPCARQRQARRRHTAERPEAGAPCVCVCVCGASAPAQCLSGHTGQCPHPLEEVTRSHGKAGGAYDVGGLEASGILAWAQECQGHIPCLVVRRVRRRTHPPLSADAELPRGCTFCCTVQAPQLATVAEPASRHTAQSFIMLRVVARSNLPITTKVLNSASLGFQELNSIVGCSCSCTAASRLWTPEPLPLWPRRRAGALAPSMSGRLLVAVAATGVHNVSLRTNVTAARSTDQFITHAAAAAFALSVQRRLDARLHPVHACQPCRPELSRAPRTGSLIAACPRLAAGSSLEGASRKVVRRGDASCWQALGARKRQPASRHSFPIAAQHHLPNGPGMSGSCLDQQSADSTRETPRSGLPLLERPIASPSPAHAASSPSSDLSA